MNLKHKLFVMLLVVVIPLIGFARGASARPLNPVPDRYRIVHGDARVTKIVVADRCLNAEDSAAKLRLVDWIVRDNGNVVARYRCIVP